MARTVTATEAKAKLLALLDDVQAGEEIEITRHGRPVAVLRPTGPRPPREILGMFEGLVTINVTEEELLAPLSDEWTFDVDNLR